MDNEKQIEQPVSQEFGEITGQEAVQSGHGRRRGLIIAGIAAVVIIAGISIAGIILNQPKVRLARGISMMTKELAAYKNPAAERINQSLLWKNTINVPHTVNADLTATFPQNDNISNLNVSLQAGKDSTSRKASMEFALGTYKVDLAKGNIIVDDNEMYISLPKLLDNTYSLRLDTLGADYNASAWKDALGIDVEPDVSYDFFESREVDYANISELAEALTPDAQMLKESITIEKAADKVSVKAKNKSMQCSGVSITIPRDAMNTFLASFQEKFKASSMYQSYITRLVEHSAVTYLLEEDIRRFADEQVNGVLDARCMNDISLNVYMDNKGRIVRVTTPQIVNIKDSQIRGIELSADFMGNDRALDVISAEYRLDKAAGMEIYTVSRDAAVTDEEYKDDVTLDVVGADNTTELTMHYQNTWNLSTLGFDGALELKLPQNTYRLSADGSYQDIVEGRSYTLDLDTASLECNDEALFRIAGTFGITPDMEEVEVPHESVDLMQMDSTAIYKMVYEAITSL